MEEGDRTDLERLVARADLARWSGLPERHPMVGLFHRIGGVGRLIAEYRQLAHLDAPAFIDEVFQHLGISLDFAAEELERIPAEGPFIVVSNHPFGVLDALAMCGCCARYCVKSHFAALRALSSSWSTLATIN